MGEAVDLRNYSHSLKPLLKQITTVYKQSIHKCDFNEGKST